MKLKTLKGAFAATFLTVGSLANAGIVDPSSTLLDDAGATLLEGWLGQGDLDWNSEWYGGIGATSSSWHAAIDTLTHTVSIYKAINSLGQEVLVGGYTTNNWSGSGYKVDSTAFIFNITQPEYQANTILTLSTYAIPQYFATFGGGHDLSGGYLNIGSTNGTWDDGYTNSHSYDTSQGTIDVGNGNPVGENGSNSSFRVIGLETFTFSAAAPEVTDTPAALVGMLPLLGLGLAFVRRRNTKK
jgi:MYXO-CTERM domain-containing protein